MRRLIKIIHRGKWYKIGIYETDFDNDKGRRILMAYLETNEGLCIRHEIIADLVTPFVDVEKFLFSFIAEKAELSAHDCILAADIRAI